jgi:hypothetical protein
VPHGGFFAVLVVVELDAISIRETVKKRSGNSTKGSAREKERKKEKSVTFANVGADSGNPIQFGWVREEGIQLIVCVYKRK